MSATQVPYTPPPAICEVCHAAPATGRTRLPDEDGVLSTCTDCRADLRQAGGPLTSTRRDR